VPPAERFALLQEHVVSQGDRLDDVTALYLSDPEQFWRICDANNAMDPQAMVADVAADANRLLRIPVPQR